MTGLEHVRFADEELIKTQVLKGEAAQTIIRGENCSVYKMENETGEGVITRYPVFPGIELLYDDIHMSCGVAHREDPRADLLEINHCRTGRFECEFVEVLRSVEYSFDDARHMFDDRKAENIRIINVRGDSMSGTIEPGDLLFVDITVKSFDGDGIYAFLYDDTAHVKRLQMMKDKLLVISDNKSYSPWDPIEKDEMNRVFIFGKVIGSMPQTYRKHG